MKLSKSTLSIAGAIAFAGLAQAQVLTEVRVSTAGTDEEYFEILGTPGLSTDGLMIAEVEGDPGGSQGANGTLDKIYDLSGNMFLDEYFVFGSPEAAANLTFGSEIDLSTFGGNLIENSSSTIYLLMVPDANLRADIAANWAVTDITDPVGSTTTRFATTAGITILDAVGFSDGGAMDVWYDGVPVFGPDGTFLPSGIQRSGGCPGLWCTDEFINFGTDGVTDPGYADPSPGVQNPVTMCMEIASAGACGGSFSVGSPYCMVNANSTGVEGVLTAAGTTAIAANDLTLTASSLPTTSFGFFLASRDTGFVANPGGSAGNLCLGGSIGRYVGPGQIQNSGSMGEFSLALDLMDIPQPTGGVAVMAGDTWRFQTWFRDAVMGTATSNFTNGLEVAF